MINATLTLFSSYLSVSLYVPWVGGNVNVNGRGVGVFKSTFEDWGPLFQMSGSTASAIEI